MLFAVVKILVTACALLTTGPAMALRVPTDTELRTAYCTALIRADSNQLDRQADWLLIPKNLESPLDPLLEKEGQDLLLQRRQLREEDERALRRLNLYLLPRLHELDPLQLVIATKRGEEDGSRRIQDMIGCAEKTCEGQASNSKSCIEACFRNKGIYAIFDQLKTCRDPTWLPF